mmetsp:Transcript_39311/g.77507  ORF Transcript_39311/g.77507 Transcript_39311/m.77507 type:complete len:223 (+) Transcript_39311:328-996(+)
MGLDTAPALDSLMVGTRPSGLDSAHRAVFDGTSWILSFTYTCCTVMRFCVKVPVLSLQMHVVEPSVSTASSCFTSTCFFARRLAVKVKLTVTVASKPSGTLATMMPMPNTMALSTPNVNSAMMKNVMPRKMARAEMMVMKRLISFAMGVSSASTPDARLAILPITVSSPVSTTNPFASPSETMVPKNARQVASSGFGSPTRLFFLMASGSPVRLDWSHLKLV